LANTHARVTLFELVVWPASCVTASAVLMDSRSDRLEGALLIGMRLISVIAFFSPAAPA